MLTVQDIHMAEETPDEQRLSQLLSSVQLQLQTSTSAHDTFAASCAKFERIAHRFRDEAVSTQQQLTKYTTQLHSTSSPSISLPPSSAVQ